MTTYTKLPDWRPRLISYLTAKSDQGYDFGYHDCCLLIAGGIDAMTGSEIVKNTSYDTPLDAKHVFSQHKVRSARGMVITYLGKPSNSKPQDGDVVRVRCHNGKHSFGLVFNRKVYLVGERSLISIPLKYIVDCWVLG